jgi:hypothetical protein
MTGSYTPKDPVNWRTVNAVRAKREWVGLRDWVGWLCARYALDHHTIPPCWYLHGALVETLTALRDHHRWSYDREAPATAPAEWQRIFRDLEARLRDIASRTGCTRDQHRADVLGVWPEDTARWLEHVDADVADREAKERNAAFPAAG